MSRRFDAGGCPIVATECHVRCALRMTEARWSIDRSCISEKIAPSFRLQMKTFFFQQFMRRSRVWKSRYFSARGNNRSASIRPSVCLAMPFKKSMQAERRDLLAKVRKRNCDEYARYVRVYSTVISVQWSNYGLLSGFRLIHSPCAHPSFICCWIISIAESYNNHRIQLRNGKLWYLLCLRRDITRA